MLPDAYEYIRLTEVLAALGVMLSALELLIGRGQFSDNGLLSWPILKTSHQWTASGTLAPAADALLAYPNVVGLFAVQFGAATLLLLGAEPRPLWLALVLTTLLLFQLRSRYGLDGADQMQIVVFAGLLVFALAPTDLLRVAAVLFVAAQALLSYMSAGWAKMVSEAWRGGHAVAGIVSTKAYGSVRLTRFLSAHRRVGVALSWATIGFECFLPFLVLAGPIPCAVFLGCGIAFHLSTAAIMGLNSFFWSFVSTYPILLLVSLHLPW